MQSQERKNLINTKYRELIAACNAFSKDADLRNINKAYELALKAEKAEEEKAKNLDILHTLEIALVVVNEIGLGPVAVVCILLHNMAELKLITITEIQKKFGKTVANIVDGFIRLSNIHTDKVSAQSDNFRKLFLTFVEDVRVILLKTAHRLYDMKNYASLPENKKELFLDEVTHLYIPIAHRLGLYNIKSELEELSMQYRQPEIYQALLNKIQASKAKQKSFLQEFIKPIERELMKQKFDTEFKSRPKSVHSIWAKMQRQNVEFEQVYDLFAIRIISNSKASKEKEDCWKIYSIVTNMYAPNPKRLRDWISTPKASGYESLHTTVMGPNNKWVEVQIRSKRMDENAEKGQAAHWRYKSFKSKKESENWLNQVRDILENPEQLHFDGAFEVAPKNNNDKIFIFTPNGDLKQLPANATVLDFAYEIHTDVGAKCSGAKVNNKNVPIRHILKNGDKVEIITGKNQKPKSDWLHFVNTPKARNKIKRFLYEEKYKEAELGKEILQRKFKNWKIVFSEETISRIIKYYKFKSAIDFYYSVAKEGIELTQLKNILAEATASQGRAADLSVQSKPAYMDKSAFIMINEKIPHVNYSLAKCCNPISGDDVFGFITVGKGITVHRINCPNAQQMILKYSYRIIDIQWQDADAAKSYIATVRVVGKDNLGIMSDLTTVISKDLKVNMQSISMDSKDGVFEGKIKVHVKDNKHLEALLHKLARVEGVSKAIRIDSFQ